MAETLTIVIEARDDTRAALASASGGFQALAGGAGTAALALGAAAVAAGALIATKVLSFLAEETQKLASAAFSAVAAHERLTMVLNTLLARELVSAGGAETMAAALVKTTGATQELVRWTERLAILSPFTEEDIGYLLRITMFYGMSSEQAKALTQALADLGGGAGLSGDQLQRLGLALGQVEARGRLTGEEMRQLTNAGIGVEMIARAMKIPIDQVAEAIEKKKIAAEELVPALIKIIQTDFAGAGARAALSWAGLAATLSDLSRIVLRTLFAPALEAVKPLVIWFVTTLQDPAFRAALTEIGIKLGQDIARALGVLGEAVETFRRVWEALWPYLQAIVTRILRDVMPFIKDQAADAARFFNEQFQKVYDWTIENWPLIQEAILEAIRAIRVVWEFVWPYQRQLFTSEWEIIKLVLGGALDVLMRLVKIAMQVITGDWGSALLGIGGLTTSFITTILRIIGLGLSSLWELFLLYLANVVKLFGVIFTQIWQTVSGWMQTVHESASGWLAAIHLAFSGWLGAIHGAVSGWMEAIVGTAGGWLGALSSSFASWFGGILTDLVGILGRMRTALAHVFEGVHIPLPHFSINWMDVLGHQIPAGVSVDWYGSGLDAIFNRPTLIGVGERGAERVTVQPLGSGAAGGASTVYNIYPSYRQSESEGSLRNLVRLLQMGAA